MKTCLVALADTKFLNQAKQLFSTVHWNSGWHGDLCLLAHDASKPDVEWFIDKGILVKICEPLDVNSDKTGDKITASKIYLFDDFFKQWDYVVYLDVDIVTRGSIDGVLNNLSTFSACCSLGQNIENNLVSHDKIPLNILGELKQKYDFKQKAFNSGVMAFPTSIIYDSIKEDILSIYNKYVNYGLFGGDQLPFNLFFYGKWAELPSAYNQITPLRERQYDTRKLTGLIIHCVSFGDGPWDENSVFYDEWKNNLDNADCIDLNVTPRISIPTSNEIRERSGGVVRTYLMGGTANIGSAFKRARSAVKVLVNDPRLFFGKIKQLFHQLRH